ncbi:Putative G-protein coupled receptor 25 [Chelonia mydas]|uniref:Putative G-protein coupled receptor 25 n=1 Tax=Chelonia mydas TaxID=8469 RepID=M7ALU8_CHEMY|nr:Putative G-protein coupled receptor 25 [Chelonia mydas]
MTTEAWTVNYEASSAVYSDYNPLQDTCPPQDLPYAWVYIPILYFIAFFVGFMGNLLVIVLMAKKKGSKRLVDTFVLNLAVADLVFVCTLPLWAVSAAYDNKWYFGEGMCKFSSFIISVNRSSSILFLMGMSVERYLVVMKRVDSKSTGTKNCLIIACGCIWAVSLLLGIPSMMYRKLSHSEDTTGELCEDEDSIAFQGADLSCWALMALRRGLTISACLAFMNSCVNPIIYALMDHHFRRQVLQQRLRVCGAFQETQQTSVLSVSSATESSLMFASRNKPPSPASIRPEM